MIATHTEQETLLERVVADMPTMPDAACQVDPELFFVFETERSEIKLAQAICAGCPEFETCKAWTLANPHLTPYGVWGGMTESERNKIRRRNQPARRRRKR